MHRNPTDIVNCKKATYWSERAQAEKIGIVNRVRLGFHMLICKGCARFRDQSCAITRLLQRSPKEEIVANSEFKSKLLKLMSEEGDSNQNPK